MESESDMREVEMVPCFEEVPRLDLPHQPPLPKIEILLTPEISREPETEPEPLAPVLVVAAKWSSPSKKQVIATTSRGDTWFLEPDDERLSEIEIADSDITDAPRIVTGAEFLSLFTPAEVAALWTADPRLMAGAMKVMAQNSANLSSDEAKGLLYLAVSKKVLTADRAKTVLIGERP